jgi:hypothetical protein
MLLHPGPCPPRNGTGVQCPADALLKPSKSGKSGTWPPALIGCGFALGVDALVERPNFLQLTTVAPCDGELLRRSKHSAKEASLFPLFPATVLQHLSSMLTNETVELKDSCLPEKPGVTSVRDAIDTTQSYPCAYYARLFLSFWLVRREPSFKVRWW